MKKQIFTGILVSSLLFLASCGNISQNKTVENLENTSINTQDIVSETNLTNIKNISESGDIKLTGESISITKAGEYNISGNIENGQILVDVGQDEKITLNLNGVNITNNSGSAIYIKTGKATINLNGENILTDGKNYADTSDSAPNGTIYSEEDLKITGTGSLNITANYADGIASKDDLIIENGNFVINSADDAIRGKDSLQILDGNFNIVSAGDGLKSTHESDATKGYIHIKGGKFEISAGSDGIQAITKVTIDGGEINVKKSTEGIEATQVHINSGKITLNSTDDGINASQKGLSDGSDILISITGGDLDVTMASGDTDAIDSNGDLIVSGGNINIKAQFAFDFDGEVTFTGGDITVNGEKVTTITNSMMGGPRGGMGGGMRPW